MTSGTIGTIEGETATGEHAEETWRRRAAESDAKAARAQALYESATAELAAAREAIDASERRREIDAALWEAGAADMEVARLLTEVAVTKMDAPDVALAVRDLAASKPFLFRARAGAGGAGGAGAPGGAPGAGFASAMSARAPDAGASRSLAQAAEDAALSGDRAALLRYLRLRRGAG